MLLNNSIYNGILSIKSRLTSSISEQNDILDILSDGLMTEFSDAVDAAYERAISNRELTLNVGSVVGLSKSANSDTVSFSWNDGSNDHVVDRSFSELSEDFGKNVPLFQYAEDVNDVPDITVENILQSLSTGEATNEAILKANELFLLNPNVSNSDLVNTINTVQGGVTSDINSIKTHLISMSTEGKVSNYSWITYLNKLLAGSKESVDNGTLTVSSENFFTLQTFMETVLNVASVVFNVVLQALGAIFGGLLRVLSLVLDVAVSLFNSTFDTDYEYKPNATYPGVKGTFYAGQDTRLSWITNAKADTAIRLCYGSEDVFLFQQGNFDDGFKVYVQSQPTLSLHPDRFIKYLRDYTLTTSTPTVGHVHELSLTYLHNTIIPNYDENLPDLDADNYPFIKNEEYVTIGLDKDLMIKTLKLNILAAILFRCRNLVNVGYPTPITTVNDTGYLQNDGRCYALYFAEKVFNSNDSATSILNEFSLSSIRQIVTDIVSLGSSNDNTSTYSWAAPLEPTNPIWKGVFENYPVREVPSPFNRYHSNISISEYAYGKYLTINEDMDTCITDSIPHEDMISIPSLDVSAVLLALGIVAAITTATIVAGKRINSAMKAKKQVKQTNRLLKLNELRTEYANDPTSENKAKYTKALASYNAKSNLFGWGSYDAANGWMNPPANSVVSTTSSLLNNVNVKDQLDKITGLIA